MIEIVLFGTGNLATHLYHALSKSSHFRIIQVFNHKQESLEKFSSEVSITTNFSEVKKADIYLLALKDAAIANVAESIQNKNALVIHTSGGTEMNVLKNFDHRGIFYLLQTFSRNKEVNFTNIPICLEANQKQDLEILKKLATELSDKVYFLNSEQRKAAHVAAVFVSNFVNYLYTEGAAICAQHEIPFEILQPLIEETAEKIKVLSPENAQTGPALRNDQLVIENHLELLNDSQKKIYQLLTSSIQDYHGKKL